jgi:hypothetical protein
MLLAFAPLNNGCRIETSLRVHGREGDALSALKGEGEGGSQAIPRHPDRYRR